MILRFLYKIYKRQLHNLMIEDLLMNIPNKVGKPAIEILSTKREPVTKWLYYEANAVSRRVPTDFDNLERRNGILIMIQAMLTAIATSTFQEEKNTEKNASEKNQVNWRGNIEDFKKGVIKK